MKIPRFYSNLSEFIKENKVLLIYGPRQVGKTTLLKDFLAGYQGKYKLDSGDDLSVRQLFEAGKSAEILEYARGYDLIAIDEAQKIKNIGAGLKILTDQGSGIKIVATGSSSFELAGQIGEPLTGRKNTLTLFPVAQIELKQNDYELGKKLEEFLIYGGYPEVAAVSGADEKRRILNELLNSYLLKDILELDRVKNSQTISNLLRLLAFQIGGEVSLSELARQLGIDYKTVARYLDLLEKTFIIFSLRGFSRNLRKEITKKNKYYFYDNGIRNAIIANFNELARRDDVGKLWENFLFAERFKKRAYQNIYANIYFWRTWDQKEIDLLEERDGKIYGYEFKWGDKLPAPPRDFLQAYPEAEYQVINQKNYLEFIA